MTTYRAIASTETDPQAPETSALFKALEANPTAIAEGASGAPRIHLAALYDLVTGTTIKLRRDTLQTVTGAVYTQVASVSIIQAGTVNMYLEHRATAATVDARVRRQRAGSTSTIATFSTSSGSFVAQNTDVTVIPGDMIIVDHRGPVLSGDSEIQNIRLRTDTAVNVFPMDNYGYWENM